jgi:hypothetical protein
VTTTPETIAELKRLLAEATPGPWLHETMAKCVSGGTPLRAICRWSADRNDADLIAAGRNALPSLLADIEMLRDALVKISNHRPGIGGDGQIARKALAATEVQP